MLAIDVDDTRVVQDPPAGELVAEACDLLDVMCTTGDTRNGPVVLILADNCTPDGYCGRHRGSKCDHTLWAIDDVPHVAHEIGHVLIGPAHHDDPENLMWADVAETELTSRQRRDVEDGFDEITSCR